MHLKFKKKIGIEYSLILNNHYNNNSNEPVSFGGSLYAASLGFLL